MRNEEILPNLRAKTSVQVYLPNLGVIEEGQVIDVSAHGKEVWKSLIDNSPFEIEEEKQVETIQEEEVTDETSTRV